jgi:hypothetical protein
MAEQSTKETSKAMKSSVMLSVAASCLFLLFVFGSGSFAQTAFATKSAWPQPTNIDTPTHSLERASLAKSPAQILFDDFDYSTHEELTKNGWIIRSAAGWPGVPGAAWPKENVSFIDDPNQPGNRLLRMASSTNGTGDNTKQTQICHQRKYLEGTYAARAFYR